MYCPPLGFEKDEAEGARILKAIAEAAPDLLCVAFGAPKQEIWMQENRAQLNVGAILAVGAALDTQAGLRRRAPQWVQHIALEWLFRLLMEPRRLWRRYLIGNTQFVLLVMRQWARGKLIACGDRSGSTAQRKPPTSRRRERLMKRIEELQIRLFSDGADLAGILEMYEKPWIRGFTTNPTLMRKAGVEDYESFARTLLRAVPDLPISLEVFADEEAEMEMQALTMATWGANVNVKIPVTNRAGVFMGPLIRRLAEAGVALNVTAILTLEQVRRVADALKPETWAIVSVFGGAHRGHGHRPYTNDGGGQTDSALAAASPAVVGQSAGTAEYFSGGGSGMRHYHRAAGNSAQDGIGRQRSGGVFAGDGGNVSPRCAHGGVSDRHQPRGRGCREPRRISEPRC